MYLPRNRKIVESIYRRTLVNVTTKMTKSSLINNFLSEDCTLVREFNVAQKLVLKYEQSLCYENLLKCHLLHNIRF